MASHGTRRRLGEALLEALRRDILTLRRAPGEHLDEAGLATAFGVSRTPVREALKELAAENLVELHPGRGARVSSIRLEEAGQYFDALRLIQQAVLMLAAQHPDPGVLTAAGEIQERLEVCAATGDHEPIPELNFRFHEKLGEMAGNQYLQQMYLRLLQEGTRLSWLPICRPRGDWSPGQLNDDHRAILAALAAGDVARAGSLADRHTELFRREVMAALVGGDRRLDAVLARLTPPIHQQEPT